MFMGDAPDIGTSVAVGTTTIIGGTSGRVLYDNGGLLGEMTTTGSGTVVVLATGATLVTPTLGVAGATSLATLAYGGVNASGSNATATGAVVLNSLSTGNATNPNLVFQVGVKTSSGSSQATATTALTIAGETLAATFAGAVSIIGTLQLGSAYSAGAVLATGTVAVKDSTGTTYNVLVHT